MLKQDIRIHDLGQELCTQLQVVVSSLNSPDSLIRLVDALQSLVAKDASHGSTSFVHPSSPLGLFLRRCIASFRLLPFESVVDLYTRLLESRFDFESEEDPSDQPHEQTNAPWKPGPVLDSILSTLTGNQDDLSFDAVLSNQVSALLDGNILKGAALPSNATLLQLSEAIKSKNYGLAVDILHKHHDLERRPDESLMHQRSLLSLSHLHSSFGHTGLSLDALHESIRMAQQYGDLQCLGDGLLTLSQLMMATYGAYSPSLPGLGLNTQPSHNHWQMLHSLLSRCLSKGQELKRPDIIAFARLGLTQTLLMVGGGSGGSEGLVTKGGSGLGMKLHPNLALVLSTVRDLTLILHIALTESAAGEPSASEPPPSLSGTYPSLGLLPSADTVGLSIHICQELERAASSSQLLQAHAMLLYGCPLLSFTQVVSSMMRRKTEDRGLQQALLLKSIEQRIGLEAALKALSLVPTTQSKSVSQSLPFAMARHSLQIRQAIVEDNLSSAWVHLEEMCALSHPCEFPSPSMEAEALRHCALICIASMNYAEAQDAASRMFTVSSYHGLQSEAEEALLLLSKIYMDASSEDLAIPCLRSLLNHSSVSRHDSIHKQARVLLKAAFRSQPKERNL